MAEKTKAEKDFQNLKNMVKEIKLANKKEERVEKWAALSIFSVIITFIWIIMWVLVSDILNNTNFLFITIFFNFLVSAYMVVWKPFEEKDDDPVKDIYLIFFVISLAVIFCMPTVMVYVLCFGEEVEDKMAEEKLGDSRAELLIQYGRLDTLTEFNRRKWSEEKNRSIADQICDLENRLTVFLAKTGPLNSDHIIIWPQTELLLQEVKQLIEEIKA